MIRFQDTVEKKDDCELLSSTGFQDIKPTGSMSTEEAVSFLDGLFSVDPDSQDMYSVEDESLLAKIFGRYEDEFDFDFELDDEVQLVLDRFDSDKWERLSDGERKVAIQDLAAAYHWAISLAEEAGLYAGAFPEDFDARCTRALQLKPGPSQIPPSFATEARAVGLTPEQTRALLGPIVTLDEVTLPLLLPRIKASLEAGKPVLCVRTPTYDSRALYGLTTTLIDGYRPDAADPSAPQLHLNFALYRTNDYHHSLRPDWFPLEALFKNSKGGKLVFLP